MGEELPSEFDLIVVGTGLIESIIAAAASRVGKVVLHVDTNDFYGGYWASFNLESIQSLPDKCEIKANPLVDNVLRISDSLLRLGNISRKWSENEEAKPSVNEDQLAIGKPSDAVDTNAEKPVVANEMEDKPSPKALALKEFRKFNIDLIPKLLFARGELVQLLISSNICRYAEFRSVDRVLTLLDGQLRQVPCNRADIFSSTDVTNVERRLLMKHIMSCASFSEDSDDFRPYACKTFAEYLTDKRLTPKLKHIVLVAIAMANEQTPCFVGVRAVQAFLESSDKYGDTPFLFPMYGCGEIPQCFCRLCAVFGGVYCLKRNISEILLTPDSENVDRLRFDAIKLGDQNIKAKNVIFGHGTVDGVEFPRIPTPDLKALKAKCGDLSRGIFLSDRPIGDETLNAGGGGVMFLKLSDSSKTEHQTGGAHVVQLSHYSGTCPKNWYLIHITCPSSDGSSPEADLAPYVQQLLPFTAQPDSPFVWSMYFSIPACHACSGVPESPYQGLHLSCGPSFELDYDASIEKAKNLFKKLYPGEEFLPRAPDPEEIINGGEELSPSDQAEKGVVDDAE